VNYVGSELLLWLLLKVGNFKVLIVDSRTAKMQKKAKELQGKMAII